MVCVAVGPPATAVVVGVTVGYVTSTAPMRRPRGLTAVIVGPPTTLKTKQVADGVGVGCPAPAVPRPHERLDRVTMSGVPSWRSIESARAPSVADEATVTRIEMPVPSEFTAVFVSSTATSGSATSVDSFRNRTFGVRPELENPSPVTCTANATAPTPTVVGDTALNASEALT
jgi:hypothetical protein